MIDLREGDCFKIMEDIPDKGVDLLITSPPYNMNLRIRNGKYCSRQIVKELTTKYNSYPDNLPMEDYELMLDSFISECLRISKLIFFNVQYLTGNKPALFSLMGKYAKNMKEFIIWDKINAQPAIGKNVLNSRFEVIWVMSEEKDAVSRHFKTAQFDRGTLQNLWQIKRGKKIHSSHGATFPEELTDKIIENFSEENAIVMDPMMGTGTTGVSSVKLNRNFIGIEQDKNYFEIASQRIKDQESISE